jgi:RmuC family
MEGWPISGRGLTGRLRTKGIDLMTLLLAFIAGAVCTALLILLTRRNASTGSIPALTELQHAVQQIRVDQQGDSGQLRGLVEGVVNQQEQLVRQTGLLSEALRRPGVRGQWGETTLRQVVEAAGLAEHFDFDTQTHIAGDGETNAARPDLVVHLPGGGCVPVDAKVPLDAYLDAVAAETPFDGPYADRTHDEALVPQLPRRPLLARGSASLGDTLANHRRAEE